MNQEKCPLRNTESKIDPGFTLANTAYFIIPFVNRGYKLSGYRLRMAEAIADTCNSCRNNKCQAGTELEFVVDAIKLNLALRKGRRLGNLYLTL